MSRTDEELTRLYERGFPDDAPGEDLWEATRSSMHRKVRVRRAAALASLALVAAVVVALPQVLLGQGPERGVEFADTPPPEPKSEPEVSHTDKPFHRTTAPPTADDDAAPDPRPEPEPEPGEPDAPEAQPDPDPLGEPARVEVRNERLYLVDADGNVLRTLLDEHDGSQEYTLRGVSLRPNSTTRDLEVAFVTGYMTANLRVLEVRKGGEPHVYSLTTVDLEQHDHQPMALPAPAWSPDGAFLAWLEPDAGNRAVLRAVRWGGSVGGPIADATPPGGVPVDPDGIMDADVTRGLELLAWEGAGGSERFTARAYEPHGGGATRHYVIGVARAGDQVQVRPLARA